MTAKQEMLVFAQMRAGAVEVETLTVPSPGEFFAAIDRHGKVAWMNAGRAPVNLTSPTRAQMAFTLGMLVTDAYTAVENLNSQEVKNIGRDILNLARTLNIDETVLARGNSINDFAENNDWNALREEIEATQNEAKLALIQQKDESLITLISLGAWLRSLQAASALISQTYAPETAALLHQASIANLFLTYLNQLPERIYTEFPIQSLSKMLQQLSTSLQGQMIIQNGLPSSSEPPSLFKKKKKNKAPINAPPPAPSPPPPHEPIPLNQVSQIHQQTTEAIAAAIDPLPPTSAEDTPAILTIALPARKVTLDQIALGLPIDPTDTEVELRARALELANAFANDGYKTRDGIWTGQLSADQSPTLQVYLFAGNEYWFSVAALAPTRSYDAQIFDEEGHPLQAQTYTNDAATAIGLVATRTGIYYIQLKVSNMATVPFCFVYSYK